MSQHFLPPDIPDAAAAYIASMPPGRVELFSLAPLDRTGVACWNAIFLNQDGTRFHGVTPARALATAPPMRRRSSAPPASWPKRCIPPAPSPASSRRTGSYAALSAAIGARAASPTR